MRFEARWDRKLRASTWAASAGLSIGAVTLLVLGWREDDPVAQFIASAFALLLMGLVVVTRALAPIGFAVEGSEVKVLRRFRPHAIPLSRLRAAGPYRSIRGSLRLGGSGGLFGWFGRHWSRPLGLFRLAATRTTDLVQLDTPAERWILSPDPADRFLDEVLARAPGAVRVPAEGPHERHPVSRATWIRLGALLLAGPAVAGTVFLASLGLAPVGVKVDRWTITIGRRWAEPVEIPVSSVRAAEVLPGDRIGRLRKVSGFSSSGHAWGRFRSDRLGQFRLYAWGRGGWVLLRTDDGNVVLTPADPDRFVADVRAAIEAHR